MQRLFVFAVWCFVLSFFQTAKVESSPTPIAELSEAEQREQRVVDRFWSLLEKTPRRGTSLDRVYGFYVDTGRLDELVERCRKLTDEQPEDGRAWLLYGLVLSRRSDDAATTEALKNATKFDAEEPLSPFYLGEAYIAQGQLKEAADSLELSLQRSLDASKKDNGVKAGSAKDILATLQTLGRVYERFGDQEKSAQIWNKLEELFPGDRDILIRIAETLEEEGKFDEAFKRYRQLAEMSKDDKFARVQYMLAASDIKIRLGDKQGAIDDFEKLLEELSGESWLAQSIRDRVERIFVRQADYAGLAGYYQKRLQKHPNELETIRRLTIALVRLSRTEEAKKLLESALEKAPSNIPLRLALIDLLVADKNFDEVDKQYAKIDELEPNNPDYVSQWGLAVLENTKLDEAQRKAAAAKIWNRLVAAKPNDPSTIVMIAELMNQAKIFDEAEKLYKKAIELRPQDPTYKEYLGYFYHHQERKDDAVKTLRQIAEGDRRTAANLAQLGGIFKSLGYVDEAISAMQAAVELVPDDFELRMQFGDLLFLNDKPDEAEKEFLAAEKLVPAISEEAGRFLQAYTKLLQSTLRLNEASEMLQKELQADQNTSDETQAAAYWRLAVYETALGRMNSSTDAIEKAILFMSGVANVAQGVQRPAGAGQNEERKLQSKPSLAGSNVLLEAAANIYDKGNDQVKAAEIYEKLAASDPQRRVDHLKRLANIQRELGEMDRAIETAKLVMATGAGNAANSRFYADMLLGIGRKKDGIEALRRAVRLDPTDTTTLSALAEVLFDAEQTDEALEILWRIFDRTEDLQGKIGLVGRMSNYYQQAQRFDQLIERLRKNSNDPASRRETAYCLAQAYVTVSDYEAARQTLEMLLLGGEADGESKSSQTMSDDTLLLSQLSKISELQGDIATAIRYQEMLCDQLQSGPQAGQENERLLSLYQQEGDKDKAINHLLNYFVVKGKLHEQIKAIDDLLARSDYASAEKILDRIESKDPNHWELLYRRMEIDYWLGKLDEAEKTARQLIASETASDEESAKIQYEKSKTKPIGQSKNQQGASNQYFRYSGGRSPWGFGEHGYYNHYYGGSGKLREAWQKTSTPLIMTLFREKLQLERYYYHQSGASTTEPAKPQFEPETFGDARFAAELWLLKIALQRDLNEFRANNPAEEGKAEIAVAESTGFKPERFSKAIDALRTSLPVDAKVNIQADTQTLLDRLRLEYFFQQFYQTTQQNKSSFQEGNYAKLLFTLKDDPNAKNPTETATVHVDLVGQMVPVQHGVVGDAALQPLRSKIEQELGMKGEKEWLMNSYNSILTQLSSEIGLKLLDKYDQAKEFDGAVEKLSPEDREKFGEELLSETRRYFLERYKKLYEEREEKQADDSLSQEQKIDWIYQCWKDAIDSISSAGNPNNYYQIIYSAPQLLRTLDLAEPSTLTEKLRQLLQKASDENPKIAVQMSQAFISSFNTALSTEDAPKFFFLLRQAFPSFWQEFQKKQESENNEAEKKKIAKATKLVAKLQEADQSETMSFENRFDAFKTAIEQHKTTLLRAADENQKTKPSPGMQSFPTQLLPQQFSNYLQNFMTQSIVRIQEILNPDGDNQFRNVTEYHYIQGATIPIRRVAPVTGIMSSEKDEKEKSKLKLSRKQLEEIAAFDKESGAILDFYFELMNELDALTKNQTAMQSTAISKKAKLPNLTNYRSYFEHNQTLHRYQLNSMLQGGQGNVIVANQPDVFLFNTYNSLQSLDDRMKTVEAENETDAALIRTDRVKVFERYLDEKSKTASEEQCKRIEMTQSLFESQTQGGNQARTNLNNEEIDVDKTIDELEKEKTESTKKDETFDSGKNIVLAILYKQKGDLLKAVECLDALKLTASGDIRYREQLVLKWFPGLTDNKEFKKRTEIAVQRLSGYQLKGDELKDMRQIYRLLGKNDEANRLRDRMLVVSTDLNTQYELLNELRNDKDKEKAAQYALKIFRSPAVRAAASGRQENFAWHVRSQSLEVLKNVGKLGEIVEQIEAQWKSAPGSLDIMTALADIYQKAGRTEDAKKIAAEMAAKIPDDAQKMQNYANLLQNIGMKNEAAEWMQKSIAKNPEQILSNFWQYENSFRESKQTKKLIEILKTIKPQRLAGQFGQFAYRLSEWSRNEETKAAAKDLLQYIWNMDGLAGNELWRSRDEFIRQLSHSGPNVDFYPMFHEVLFRTLTPTAENKNEPINNSPMSVSAWGSSQIYSVSVTFFDLAGKKDENKDEKDESALLELKKEFQKLLSENFADDKTKKDQQQRYRLARMFLAMNEIRLKNAKEAVEIIESLDMTKPASRGNPFGNQEFVVMGLELSKLDDPKAAETAIKLFENEIKGNPDSHVQQVVLVPLYKLYLKSDRADEGRKLALGKLQESFRFMRLAGSNHYYQVGNRHYGIWELSETATSLSRALLDAGYAFDLMLLYRRDYDGQAWVSVARKNYGHHFRTMDKISKELDGKISEKDFVQHIEQMIPGMSVESNGKSSDETEETKAVLTDEELKEKLPMQLGRYIIPVKDRRNSTSGKSLSLADLSSLFNELKDRTDLDAIKTGAASDGSLAGIRLADSLQILAKENPKRYETIKQAIEKLERLNPDEPTVFVALTCCRLIDGDEAASKILLRRCADWVKTNESTDKLTDQICLGFWAILKLVFEKDSLKSDPEVVADCRAVFPVLGKLIGRLSVNKSDNEDRTNSSEQVYALLLDLRRRMPESMLAEFKPDFDANILEKVLLPEPGRLTRQLETHRQRIAKQLSDSIALKADKPVMQAFEKVFQSGWPLKEESGSQISRTDSMYLLGILEQVLETAKQTRVDPKPVFSSLLNIVLPEDAVKLPFLGIYSDLGGENGYFRTPAADLVDWAVSAGRVDDLKKRLAEKRKQGNAATEETAVQLDAVELILAAKTKDEKRFAELKKKFFDGIEKNDSLKERFALVAAMPCIKDSEFADLDEEQYKKLIDLVDSAIEKGDKDNHNRRYTYYIIRSLYDRFSRDAELPKKIRWLTRYRKITDAGKMDGFRFTMEDRLYREGIKAVEENKLVDAVKILQYFADCPSDQFRYRNLNDYLDTLLKKIDALSESERKELLGDFDLAKVDRQSKINREKDGSASLAPKDFDLPPLPTGKVVYQNDFNTHVGPEWSIDRRDTMPKIDRTFLGEFHSEDLRFKLNDLPGHRFVRIRFDLLMLGGLDGLVGYTREFGVDVWGMRLKDGLAPIISTFSNFHKDPNNQKQSFPDDYPPEFGVEPTWYGRILSEDIWDDNLEKGFYYGREGAIQENKFGYEKDAVYAVDLIVPHDSKELEIEFFTKFQDGPYGGNAINLTFGESWGLDNFSVELIDKELNLDENAFKQCFDALIGNDASKAAAARWRLVAAGDASVDFISNWFNAKENEAKAKEILKEAGNFDLFRINRVLELIGTPKAKSFRFKQKPTLSLP